MKYSRSLPNLVTSLVCVCALVGCGGGADTPAAPGVPPPDTTPATLQAMDGLGAWNPVGGNSAHSSYIPASFDPAKFSMRWVVNNSRAGLAIDNGLLFADITEPGMNGIQAISEQTGQRVWFAPGQFMNIPTVSEGKVFVARNTDNARFLDVYAQTTGKLLTSLALDSLPGVPVDVFQGQAYVQVDQYHALSKRTGSAYAEAWRVTLPAAAVWNAAIDDTSLYSLIAGNLFVINQQDGTYSTLSAPYPDVYGPVPGQVVLAGPNLVLGQTYYGDLVAFDTAAKSVAWRLNRTYPEIAVAKGVFYGVFGSALEARSTRDGALRWSAPAMPGGQHVLVTDNLAFVSAGTETVAIDLATQQLVWRYPTGGALGISNRGVLYIRGATITAINLR